MGNHGQSIPYPTVFHHKLLTFSLSDLHLSAHIKPATKITNVVTLILLYMVGWHAGKARQVWSLGDGTDRQCSAKHAGLSSQACGQQRAAVTVRYITGNLEVRCVFTAKDTDNQVTRVFCRTADTWSGILDSKSVPAVAGRTNHGSPHHGQEDGSVKIIFLPSMRCETQTADRTTLRQAETTSGRCGREQWTQFTGGKYKWTEEVQRVRSRDPRERTVPVASKKERGPIYETQVK